MGYGRDICKRIEHKSCVRGSAEVRFNTYSGRLKQYLSIIIKSLSMKKL